MWYPREPRSKLTKTASFLVLVLFGLLAGRAEAQTWVVTGSMAETRREHTATLLPNGKVLVAGGTNFTSGVGGYLASAELYDPATEIWASTGAMNSARVGHTATLLPNGKVLVVGGQLTPVLSDPTVSAELYDPATGTWTFTGSMHTARYSHTATLLPNGKVLIVGGVSGTGAPPPVTATAELYDPVQETFTPTGSLNTARTAHSAVLLSDGRVLVLGGGVPGCCPLSSAEVYDPVTGVWTTVGALNVARGGSFPGISTLLSDGRVLATGGTGFNDEALASAELYDPATQTFALTGNMNVGRIHHSITLLPGGRVLAAGGRSRGGGPGAGGFTSAEIYNPASESWTLTASMNIKRLAYTATLLPDGRVLVAGGVNDTGHLASAELFTAVLRVAIDIKPGSDPNSINLSSAGSIPVAILSSATFDATQVDPVTVALAGAAVKLIGKGDKFACSPEDVNGDGLLDLVCHVTTAQFMIEPGDSIAVLEAKTIDGTPIRGEDSIQIVP